jgi:hypothetical protein
MKKFFFVWRNLATTEFLHTEVKSLNFSLIEELTYEIDVWFEEKFLTNDALDLIWSPAF